MKNKRGQAIVEFVIILPIIIYIMVGIIDVFMIINNKNNLESKMYDVVELYRKDEKQKISDYLKKDNNNIKYSIKSDEKYTTITLNQKYKFITPGFNKMFGKDFNIKAERIVLNNEEQ